MHPADPDLRDPRPDPDPRRDRPRSVTLAIPSTTTSSHGFHELVSLPFVSVLGDDPRYRSPSPEPVAAVDPDPPAGSRRRRGGKKAAARLARAVRRLEREQAIKMVWEQAVARVDRDGFGTRLVGAGRF
jgi:hypothetical protein